MARIFITGSADGLGRTAARALLDEGHEVLLHARSAEGAGVRADLTARAAGVVVGDLSSAAETRGLAGQVTGFGRMDAVVHNAGVYLVPARAATAEGHPRTLAVNTLAPRDGAHHPNLVGHQQRSGGDRKRRVLVPPETPGARTCGPRSRIPGPARGPDTALTGVELF